MVYNPSLVALANHDGYLPRACRPYRAQTKGKVERPYRDIRQDFVLARSFRNLDDLNAQFTDGTRQGGRSAVADLLVALMEPMTIEVTLAVQRELESRVAETEALRSRHVERLRYQAEAARRRYMKVDPDNRLVADALDAEWNEALRQHAEAAEDSERRRQEQVTSLDAEMKRRRSDHQLPAQWQWNGADL